MTVNFGYVELLLDWLLLAALNVRNSDAQRELITPLPLSRKCKLLRQQLPNCGNEGAVVELEEGLRLIGEANEDRNQIIHGYWALKNRVEMMAFNRKNPSSSRVIAPSVAEIADKAALSSRHLYAAYNLLNGSDPRRSQADVLSPIENGSYQVLTRPVDERPPQP